MLIKMKEINKYKYPYNLIKFYNPNNLSTYSNNINHKPTIHKFNHFHSKAIRFKINGIREFKIIMTNSLRRYGMMLLQTNSLNIINSIIGMEIISKQTHNFLFNQMGGKCRKTCIIKLIKIVVIKVKIKTRIIIIKIFKMCLKIIHSVWITNPPLQIKQTY